MSELRKSIGAGDAFFIIVGNIIGIGIFTTTGYAAKFVSSPALLLFLWLIGGILAFCGAMTYAELAARFPRTGGDYHFLSEAYHPMFGYIFGWAAFVVTYTGSIAVIAVGFSQYFLNLFPQHLVSEFSIPGVGLDLSKLAAIFVVLLLTAANARGVKVGKSWQNVLTFSGIVTLLLFIILGFSSEKIDLSNFRASLGGFGFPELISGGAALAAIFFTFSGWTAIVYTAGEVKSPEKNIPRTLFWGILVIILLYFLVNIVYLLAMPLREMADVVDIGRRALVLLRGERWSLLFTIMILLAVLSTLNATILSGGRIYYAMAKKGEFFKAASRLHPRNNGPHISLWMQAGWAILLILSGTFNQLLAYTVAMMLLFALLAGIGVFVLRYKFGVGKLQFKAYGFPITPLLFIVTVGWILFGTVRQFPLESLKGFAIVLLGIPLKYLLGWTKKIPAKINRERKEK